MITPAGPLMEAAWDDFLEQVFHTNRWDALDEDQQGMVRYLFFAGMSACWMFISVIEDNRPELFARLADELTEYGEKEPVIGDS